MKACSKCGSDNTELKSGTSKKTGKPWKGYKCQDCDNMDFVKTEKLTVAAPSNGNGKSSDAMLMAYAKDIVVAEIAKGTVKEPFKRVADGFKVLLNALNHPYSEPKKMPEVDVDESSPEKEPF